MSIDRVVKYLTETANKDSDFKAAEEHLKDKGWEVSRSKHGIHATHPDNMNRHIHIGKIDGGARASVGEGNGESKGKFAGKDTSHFAVLSDHEDSSALGAAKAAVKWNSKNPG